VHPDIVDAAVAIEKELASTTTPTLALASKPMKLAKP
jgi:hypothetical protein